MSNLDRNATKPVSVKIADTLAKTAGKTIETMFRAYHAKGGVAEMETKLEQKRNGLAQGIFELAVTASKLGQGKQSWTIAYFKEICKAAENEFKDAHADVENIKTVLPCWPVFKSELNRAIDVGLNPQDFSSYGAIKAARMEQSRAERESEEMRTGERAGTTGAGAEEGTGVAEALGAGKVTITPKLAAVLKVMQAAINGMDADTQDAFADKLARLIAKHAPSTEQKQEQIDESTTQAA
ncbi:MAG: hypothetical protein KGL39_08750 [Patescibacteria group bacterium]|nr:hypothetical protein [Patescibacteria group bacterium]